MAAVQTQHPSRPLWLRHNGQFTGAFLGKWVVLGIGATAEHLSQWTDGMASVDPDVASLASASSSASQKPSFGGHVPPGRPEAAHTGQVHLASLSLSRSPVFDGIRAPVLQGQTLTRVIDYTYDPLNRPVEASYSTGELFQYTYNAVGSTLEYSRTLAGLITDTAYSYNAAYQLLTAQEIGGPLWNYTYDGNGQLIGASPDGDTIGARRYSYSAAGYLTQVEAHDGTAFQLQAEMAYNGLGDRLALTAHVGGESLTTEYALDLLSLSSPLAATAAAQTTFYLYGLGAIGEDSAVFNYHLKDADRTARQLVDPAGQLTLARTFTPWGEPLEQIGTAELAFGYFGGLLDAATGLIYLGAGQYYDPETGRFLTPGTRDFDPFQPGTLNPYVPWSGNPLGALLGPLGLLLLFPRRKSLSGRDRLLLILLLGLAIAGAAAACEPDEAARIEPQPAGALPPTLPPEPSGVPSLSAPVESPSPTAASAPPAPSDTPEASSPPCPPPDLTPPAHLDGEAQTDPIALAVFDRDLNAWWQTDSRSPGIMDNSEALAYIMYYEFGSTLGYLVDFVYATTRQYFRKCGPPGCQTFGGTMLDWLNDFDAWNELEGDRDLLRRRAALDLDKVIAYDDQSWVDVAGTMLGTTDPLLLLPRDQFEWIPRNLPWSWFNTRPGISPDWLYADLGAASIGTSDNQVVWKGASSAGPREIVVLMTLGKIDYWCERACAQLGQLDERPERD
jgi:RHS repeat-associated protein